jgi:hypothetical protein
MRWRTLIIGSLFMRKTLMAASAAAVLGAAFVADAAPAVAGGLAGPDLTRVYPGESYAQAYYGRRYYDGGPRYYRRGNGGAAAAGVIGGLAAGAIIGGAIAAQGARPRRCPEPRIRTSSPTARASTARSTRSTARFWRATATATSASTRKRLQPDQTAKRGRKAPFS